MNVNDENIPTKVSIPQQVRSKEKWQALLNSGEELFSSKGYDKVTAKDICAHAGISVGTFYRYFLDKKQLLLTLFEQRAQSFLPDEIVMLEVHPYIATKNLIETHFKRKKEFGLFNALQSLVLQEPEIGVKVNEIKKLAEESLEKRLEELKNKGFTWPDLDVNMAAWAVLTLIFSTNSRTELQNTEEGIEKTAKIIVRMLFKPEYHKIDKDN